VIAWHIVLPAFVMPFQFGTNWSRFPMRPRMCCRRSILLPVILMYTGWSDWVFRGKVRAGIGYH